MAQTHELSECRRAIMLPFAGRLQVAPFAENAELDQKKELYENRNK
jgi:hypothetical protein